MTDVATLGLRVDGTANIDKAGSSLGRFTKSGREAEQSATALSRESQKSSTALANVARQSDVASRGMTSLASAARRAGGLLIAAIGGFSVGRVIREVAQFEDAMLGLAAVSGATASQMEDLERQARTLGATSMFSAEQAGNAQRFLAQAGFEVNEILEATPGLLDLAAAGQLDLARAADIASNVLGGFRLEVDQLNRVNDVLAATAAGANTNIEQLGLALSYAAPFAAAAGISIEETSAAIGAMSDAGIQAGRAGTGLTGIIRQLSRITPAAAAALEAAGIAVSDVDISTRGLLPVLETLNKASLEVGQSIEIFGSESGAAALNVIEASDSVTQFAGSLQDVEGEARRMALVIGSGLTGSMRGFNSMLSESILQLGRDDGLAGGFQSVTDTATGVLAVFNGLLPELVEANNLSRQQVERIETLAAGFELLGEAIAITAALYGGRFAAALVIAAKNTAAKTAASIQDARAEAAAAQQVTRRTGAELLAANTIRARALEEAKATAGTNAHAFAMQNLAAASIRATEAQAAHTAATNASTAALSRASVAARTYAASMALVGGPLGAAIIAGAAAYYFRDALGFASAAARETKRDIDGLIESLDGYTEAQYRNNRVSIVQDLAEARIEASRLQEQIAELQKQSQQSNIAYQGRPGAASGQLSGLMSELQEQNRIISANEKGLREYDQAWQDVLQSQVSGVSVFRTLDQWLMDTGDSADGASRQFDALNYTLGTGGAEWDDYIGKLRAARDVLGLTTDEAARHAAMQQGFTGVYADLAAAVAGQTGALEDYRSAIEGGNAAEADAHLARARRFAEAEAMVQAQLLNLGTLTNLLQGVQAELSAVALTSALTAADAGGAGAAYVANAIKMINERAAAIQRTTVVTETNTSANREAAKALREAEAEAARFANSLQSLEDTLFPLEAAQRTYREEQEVLTRAWNEGAISAERYTEAMRRLENAQLSAQTASGAYGGGGGFGSEIGSRGEAGSPTDPLARNDEDDYWTKWLESAETALTDFDSIAANTAENFQRGFGDAFEAMVFDSQNFGDAMYNLFDGIARSLVSALGEMAAQWLAYQAVQLIVGKTTQETASSGMITNALAQQQMAGLNAFTSTAAIPIVGPIAAPAAMAAAIAATTPSVTAITSLSAAGMAGFAEGGWTGPGGKYDVAGLVHADEVVWSKGDVARAGGVAAVEALRKGIPGYANGGYTGRSSSYDRLNIPKRQNNQQPQAVAPVVNVIENPNRAGASEQRQDQDGKWAIDIFVANIQQGGKADKAIRSNYGLSRQGV